MLFRAASAVAVVLFVSVSLVAQSPQPFPRPGQKPPAAPPPTTTAPTQPGVKPAAPTTAKPGDVPTEAALGVPLYPAAQFITSYDAGRGQRFYLFGVSASYTEIVLYYRTALKQKGNELFEAPPTHQFETGRFREESMGFPPSVTIKDFTWGGSAGYPNARRGAQPERFPTLIQIVPAPPGSAQ